MNQGINIFDEQFEVDAQQFIIENENPRIKNFGPHKKMKTKNYGA